jgi:hypothetical protein
MDPSFLSTVDIAPPKPSCNGGRVFLNPNKTMAPRALQMRDKIFIMRKAEVLPFLYTSPNPF